MASKKLTAEQQQLFDALTPLQKKFATYLLKGKNQTDAYKKAGGKAKTPETARACASEILTNPNVQAFMSSIEGSAIDEAIMTREEALRRLSKMGRTSLTDIADFSNSQIGEDEDGRPVYQASWSFKDSALQSPDSMSAIAELTTGKDGIKLKMHDPKSAIKQLAEMEGWQAPEKHEHTSPDGSMTPRPTVIQLVPVEPVDE